VLQVVKETDGWAVYYLILIRLHDTQYASPTHTNGWVVSRTLQQIKELHSDLCQVSLMCTAVDLILHKRTIVLTISSLLVNASCVDVRW